MCHVFIKSAPSLVIYYELVSPKTYYKGKRTVRSFTVGHICRERRSCFIGYAQYGRILGKEVSILYLNYKKGFKDC